MKSLQDGINFSVTPEAIENALKTVTFNQTVNKGHFDQTYFCGAVIEVESIAESHCAIHLYNGEIGQLQMQHQKFSLSFLPAELVRNAKDSRCLYIHVLLQKKLDYMGKMIDALVVPIGAAHIGYYSNVAAVDDVGKQLLKSFYSEGKFWENDIVVPRYKDLQYAAASQESSEYRQTA